MTAIARAAGRNRLFDKPTTARDATRVTSEPDKANSTLPNTAQPNPASKKRLRVAPVGERCEKDLTDQPDEKSAAGDQAQARHR